MGDIGYRRDRDYADAFVPEAKAILGQVFFREAPDFEDNNHNTDIVLDTKGLETLQISLRTRRHTWMKTYGNEFTLCFKRGSSGNDAEYQKITGQNKDGITWGTHILYSFEDESGSHIEKWFIGDFDVFRSFVPRIGYDYQNNKIYMDGEQIGTIHYVSRRDTYTGAEYFDGMYAYKRDAFPGFIIAKSEDYPPAADMTAKEMKFCG